MGTYFGRSECMQEEIPEEITPEPPAEDAAPETEADPGADAEADAAVGHALAEALPIVTLPGVEDPKPEQTLQPERASELSTEEPLVLERKHPLAIRWMHWLNFPILFTMIWSGLLIYWNDSDNAYHHPHAVYRIGIGSFTLFRFFPPAFYNFLYAPITVTRGLGYHFFFMWIFAVNGIAYVMFLILSREYKFMIPERRSIQDAIQVTLVDLHIKHGLPPQTKYNGGQRIAYTSVILMGLGSLVTGLAIYKPTSTHWLTTLCGGYEMARWLHFLLTLGFCAFFLVHVGQVILAGWNNFRSMISGFEIRRASEPSLEAERRKF